MMTHSCPGQWGKEVFQVKKCWYVMYRLSGHPFVNLLDEVLLPKVITEIAMMGPLGLGVRSTEKALVKVRQLPLKGVGELTAIVQRQEKDDQVREFWGINCQKVAQAGLQNMVLGYQFSSYCRHVQQMERQRMTTGYVLALCAASPTPITPVGIHACGPTIWRLSSKQLPT